MTNTSRKVTCSDRSKVDFTFPAVLGIGSVYAFWPAVVETSTLYNRLRKINRIICIFSYIFNLLTTEQTHNIKSSSSFYIIFP